MAPTGDGSTRLAERGVQVSYETIRRWCIKFGPEYARKFKRRRGQHGEIWRLDELFVKIRGKLHYLWRAVDQDGDVIDILVQKRRSTRAAARFSLGSCSRVSRATPLRFVTDKLKSYSALTFARKIASTILAMRKRNEVYEAKEEDQI